MTNGGSVQKELKEIGAIVKGFVKYPAKLLVKCNLEEEHYSILQTTR